MKEDFLFKLLALISPFVSGFITYALTKRSKRDEYLMQNRLPAFKDIAAVLVKIKKYCIGQIAAEEGAEFSPYFGNEELATSALILRTELADARFLNEVFLTSKSTELLNQVAEQLSMLCNLELAMAGSPTREDAASLVGNGYTTMLDVVETTLAGVYKQVGLNN